VLASEI